MVLRIQDLYTFFVVARAEAMQEAAEELGVTPGAISQRIKSIEERHGRRLFARSREGVTLTPSGDELWQDVRPAFSDIEAAHRRHFSAQNQTQLRISAARTFAHAFLVPRLSAFAAAHPQINLSVETDNRLVNLKSEPVDLALRHGLGNYPGLKVEWLCSPELVVVGSPDLLSGQVPKSPADCLDFPLLQDETGEDWPLWLEAQGVDPKRARYGTAFRDSFMIVKAAIKGQGLALIQDVYVQEELADGTLVRVLEGHWPAKFAYYAVALPDVFERPAVRMFVKWLAEMVSDRDKMLEPDPRSMKRAVNGGRQ